MSVFMNFRFKIRANHFSAGGQFFLLGGHLFFGRIFISFFRKRLEKRFNFV